MIKNITEQSANVMIISLKLIFVRITTNMKIDLPFKDLLRDTQEWNNLQ